ncbi:hypothetical protein vBRpoSV10_7 [Ruegeria phage vB_RpoS-V10]|nr:hypothetical protein DSS3P8_008 [Roseobacter phage DSS3P8]AWY09129.1 hypothetical protein vBRpoSV10_7 [Ruegeria phage vB_RpoS-V10]
MLKFVFLLTIWTAESNIPQVSVEDYGISGEDCIARMVEYVEADPMQSRGAASCELDQGEPWDELTESGTFPESTSESDAYAVDHQGQYLILPVCEYEDSDDCVWDAATRGNGKGESFYSYQGKRYPVAFE